MAFADTEIPQPEMFDDDYRARTVQIVGHRLHIGQKQWELRFQRLGQVPEGLTDRETKEWVY